MNKLVESGVISPLVRKLTDSLLNQYHYIFGEQNTKDFSSEYIIQNITTYYEDIINCMPGNVYWLDKKTRIVGCNQNVLEMFGVKNIAELKGSNFINMGKLGKWSALATESFKRNTLQVIKTGQPILNIEELPIPHHNGKMIHFLTSRVPLFDRQGNVIGIVGISTDITELKATQAALKTAKEQAEAISEAKSEFVANMSHDVKTPLSGIIGLAELLTYHLKGEQLHLAQILMDSGKQLLSFFDNCLDVFKLDNPNLTFVPESFQLSSVIKKIIDLFQPAIDAKGLEINTHLSSSIPPFLYGNQTGLFRIILNLISNAVKFTPQGSISIYGNTMRTTSANMIMLKITIIDTGIGIARDKQKIIFERFTRLTPSYKGIYEGNGIGLSIIQKLVKIMGGKIKLKSEINQGSKFTLYLPFELTHTLTGIKSAQTAKTKLSPKKNNKSAKPIKILIVEDNLTAQWMQSSLLSSLNCQVDLVDSGEKALEIFEPKKYDLIFMDIGLPGLQGDAVAKLIRRIEYNTGHHIPIIAQTAHITEQRSQQYLAAGIDSIYSKPLSREQAQEIIAKYLR